MYDRFKELCKKKGKSMMEACDDIGIKSSAVSNWKKRDSSPNGDTLLKISKYFGVTMEYLMTGSDASDLPAAIVLTDQEEELLGIFRYLSNKEELLKYARFLKEGEKARSKNALDA